MQFYQEITLIDQAEISPYFIWSKLYTQLHLALVEIKDEKNQVNIGLSFPQYIFEEKTNQEKARVSLGKKLRLFAETESDLKKLNLDKWLGRISDYVHMTAIRNVPKDVKGYAIYKRKSVKSNAEKLARHEEKKGRHSYESALAHYQKFVQHTALPYVQIFSHSTQEPSSGNKHHFKLFIEKQHIDQPRNQMFSTYGLSSTSTVPEF